MLKEAREGDVFPERFATLNYASADRGYYKMVISKQKRLWKNFDPLPNCLREKM